MIQGIQHIQITVDPAMIEASRMFYMDLLGMKQIHDPFPGNGWWASAGGQDVHIRVEANIERRKTNAHPAFLVSDLTETQKALEASGFQIIAQPKIEGFDRFHTIDPSGNRIEIMQRV